MPQPILAVDGAPKGKRKVERTDVYKSWLLFAGMMIAIIIGFVVIHKLRNWMKEEGMI